MKSFNKIIFFLSLIYFGKVNAQDVSINILNQPASVYLGATNGQITVDICNNDGGSKSTPLNKLRPLISLPSALIGTSLVSVSNTGWQIVSNDGSTIVFENTTAIAPGECSQIILGYTALNPGGPLTVTGTLGFNGSQTIGNLTGNDNSTTSITVLLDTDGDTIADNIDLDDDNDGILDTVEQAACSPSSLTCDTDGDGIPNHLDLDSDNDGINDVNEALLTDANGDGIADGTIQPNGAIASPISDLANLTDKDSDGKNDQYDPLNGTTPDGTNPPSGVLPVPSNLVNPTTGEVICATNCDPDKDGILTPVDAIPNTWGDAIDTDGDSIADDIDLDDDNDGILDTVEDAASCTNASGVTTANADCDGDGIPNRLDLDSDNDGINDVIEAGGTDADSNGVADGAIGSTGIPASAGTGLTPTDTDGQGGANPYDLDSDNDDISDLIEGGLPSSLDADNDGKVDCTANCDPDMDGILTPVDAVPTTWGDGLLPDLTPTTEIESLEFLAAGTQRDFVVKVFEINNAANVADKPIAFRVAKLSAFDITYTTASGVSNVFSAINNSNSDWTFTESANFITVTAKSGITIPAGDSKIVGFKATRKTGIPQNTSQNITVTIIFGSAGEEKVDNNIVETKITAN